MLQISNLRLEIGADEAQLRRKAAKVLGIRPTDIRELALTRQSIDARRKNDVHLVCSVKLRTAEEDAILKKGIKGVTLWEERPYVLPAPGRAFPLPPWWWAWARRASLPH